MTATDRVLSYIKQDQKTGIVKYPFITFQINPISIIDAGGSYDYPNQANSSLQLHFYDQSNNIIFN
ncbi:MAG: hypothetical protein QXV17_07500 [Candidatus Micrarchaeaceae archaeon]